METQSFGEKEKQNNFFLDKIKQFYQNRFESLEQTLQNLIDKISGQDELILVLQEDSVSANFIGLRIREILEIGLLKEKENYIENLVLEKCHLLEKIEKLEKNKNDLIKDKDDMENQFKKLLKEKEEMKSLETKCFSLLNEMQRRFDEKFQKMDEIKSEHSEKIKKYKKKIKTYKEKIINLEIRSNSTIKTEKENLSQRSNIIFSEAQTQRQKFKESLNFNSLQSKFGKLNALSIKIKGLKNEWKVNRDFINLMINKTKTEFFSQLEFKLIHFLNLKVESLLGSKMKTEATNEYLKRKIELELEEKNKIFLIHNEEVAIFQNNYLNDLRSMKEKYKQKAKAKIKKEINDKKEKIKFILCKEEAIWSKTHLFLSKLLDELKPNERNICLLIKEIVSERKDFQKLKENMLNNNNQVETKQICKTMNNMDSSVYSQTNQREICKTTF